LTATHPIKPTSTRCPSAWQPNPRQRLHLAMRKICSENRDHYSLRADAFVDIGVLRTLIEVLVDR
jgi:hypothetical protein